MSGLESDKDGNRKRFKRKGITMFIIKAQVYNKKTDNYESMYLNDMCGGLIWNTHCAALFASLEGAQNYYRIHEQELKDYSIFKDVTYINA